MPVNVRRFCTSILLTLTALGVAVSAQAPEPAAGTQAAAQSQPVPIKAPTSAEIMRDRISRAKAFIAVRNYNAAIYELENIRRETSDQSVQAVTNVLLINSYLEQGDYKRAQDFLTQAFSVQKTNKAGSADIYNAVAAQVTKSARTKVERYKALGLSVADRNLPLEAVNDIERMRETLELVINQSKDMGKDAGKTSTAMAMIEEASASRSALARDDYDAKRWSDEMADSRELLANSRSVITNAVDGSTSPTSQPAAAGSMPVPTQAVALNEPSKPTAEPSSQPVRLAANTASAAVPVRETQPTAPPKTEPQEKPAETAVAASDKPRVTEPKAAQEPPKPIVVGSRPRQTVPTSEPAAPPPASSETAKNEGPMEVGSLIDFATKRASPVYPAVARSMRASGVVRVEVTIDESGEVADVQGSSGPTLLQAAAKDAIRKWRFKPFVRDGQPVRATGFVNFNFSL